MYLYVCAVPNVMMISAEFPSQWSPNQNHLGAELSGANISCAELKKPTCPYSIFSLYYMTFIRHL